jgi:hypothetical protein
MPKVGDFKPTDYAPLFHNGPWPLGYLQLDLPEIPPIDLPATAFGLCGGMSFLARDFYEFFNAPNPPPKTGGYVTQLRGRSSNLIPVQTAQHIFKRLIDSFGLPTGPARWLELNARLDHDTWLWGPGLFHITVNECSAIMADIDKGILCPIGVILVHSLDPVALFSNHVELVWGYEFDGDTLILNVYDCNAEGRDDIVIKIDISAKSPAKPITTNGTDTGGNSGLIRGFFRLSSYSYVDPTPACIWDASARILSAPNQLNPSTPQQTPNNDPPTWVDVNAQIFVELKNTGSTSWYPSPDGNFPDEALVGVTFAPPPVYGPSPPYGPSWAPYDPWRQESHKIQEQIDPQQSTMVPVKIAAPFTAGIYPLRQSAGYDSTYGTSGSSLGGGSPFGTPSGTIQVAVGVNNTTCAQLNQQYKKLSDHYNDLESEIRELQTLKPPPYSIIAKMVGQAHQIQSQIATLEDEQVQNGCAPGLATKTRARPAVAKSKPPKRKAPV